MKGINENSLDSGISSSSVTEISQLPWEILQEILSHLDGKSLLVCKRVSQTWRDHVNYFQQKPTFWYSNCKKEIPPWVQFDLLDNIFPYHWKDQSKVNWEEIYKCWYTWECLYKAPVSVHKFVTGLNGISSIKISGEWLLISTFEGRGKLTAQQFCGLGLIDIFVSGGAILNFELVNSDRQPRSNVKPPSKLGEVFNTLAHNEIWLELKDCYIQLGKTYCYTLDKVVQKIRHSYGYEIKLMNNNNESHIFLQKMCSTVKGPEIMSIESSEMYTHIVDFWMNKISVLDLKHPDRLMLDAITVNMRTQDALLAHSVCYTRQDEEFVMYSWQGSLIIVIYTGKWHILVHKDGESIHKQIPRRKSRITAALFYCRYLFLGTETGQLLIYKVKTPDDCFTLTLYETPSWDIQVCPEKIVHIVAAEPIHHKERMPVFVCATPEDIYLVAIENR